MNGSATLWIGTAVMTRMSVSVLAVAHPEHQRVHDGAEHADVARLGAADSPTPRPSGRGSVSAPDHYRHLNAQVIAERLPAATRDRLAGSTPELPVQQMPRRSA